MGGSTSGTDEDDFMDASERHRVVSSSVIPPTEDSGEDASDAFTSLHAGDVELVQRTLEGSELARRAFEQRVSCVARMVSARNAQLGHPLARQELPDLVQDALAVIWRKLPEFEGRSSLETWIYRVCSFELMNAIRRKSRRVRRQVDAGEDGSLDWIPAKQQEAPAELRFEELYRGLSRLPRREEHILRMKHYEDQTFEDIGRELGISASGVKHHYYRGIQRLRGYLTGEREED